jgi:hypothetical protein
MVRQAQKVDQLRQPKGVLGESPLRIQKEKTCWGWFSKITAIFKVMGRPRLANKIGQEVIRNGREIPTQESNTSVKPKRVRSNNTSKASGKGSGKTVRTPAKKSQSKSKTI